MKFTLIPRLHDKAGPTSAHQALVKPASWMLAILARLCDKL